MSIEPRRYRRGDTSSERPGMIFYQYKYASEYWVSAKQFEIARIQERDRCRRNYKSRPDSFKKARDKWRAKPGSLEKAKLAYDRWVNKPEGRAVRREVTRRYLKTPDGQVANCVRSRIATALKRGETKSASTLELIGCRSIKEFRTHLERQFQEGMNWQNYGRAWEIDHRVPLASFNLSDPEQQKLAFNYHNCEPLWKKHNRVKSDRIEGELFRGRDLRGKVIQFPKQNAA